MVEYCDTPETERREQTGNTKHTYTLEASSLLDLTGVVLMTLLHLMAHRHGEAQDSFLVEKLSIIRSDLLNRCLRL